MPASTYCAVPLIALSVMKWVQLVFTNPYNPVDATEGGNNQQQQLYVISIMPVLHPKLPQLSATLKHTRHQLSQPVWLYGSHPLHFIPALIVLLAAEEDHQLRLRAEQD